MVLIKTSTSVGFRIGALLEECGMDGHRDENLFSGVEGGDEDEPDRCAQASTLACWMAGIDVSVATAVADGKKRAGGLEGRP